MSSFLDYIPIFKPDINKIITETFENKGVQQQIIDLNQSQLYDEGVDAKGQLINTIDGNPYTKNTIQIKQEKGQITDHVTLYDTGEFYDSMRTKVTLAGIEIEADFNKGANDIRDNFSSNFDFLGLTEDGLQKLKEWVFLDIFGINLRKSMNLD